MVGSAPFARPWPVELLDELLRLHGRFKTTFADVRQATGLNETELMVLNAVAEAREAATVSQIARSLGTSRQLVQKATNALRDCGMVETFPNPADKRAPLLRLGVHGGAVKATLDAGALALCRALDSKVDLDELSAALRSLRSVRAAMEDHCRQAPPDRSPAR